MHLESLEGNLKSKKAVSDLKTTYLHNIDGTHLYFFL